MIQGGVVTESGEAIKNAQVKLIKAMPNFRPPGFSDQGESLPSESQPWSRIREYSACATAITDSKGEFAFRDVNLASFDMVVEHPDYCFQVIPGIVSSAVPSDQFTRVTMVVGCVVSGIVSHRRDVIFDISIVSDQVPPSVFVVSTTQGGTFRVLERLRPGEYNVEAKQAGYSLYLRMPPPHRFRISPADRDLCLTVYSDY